MRKARLGERWSRTLATGLFCLALAVVSGCALPASPAQMPGPPAVPRAPEPEAEKNTVFTQQEGERIALDFVRGEATFRFDGIGETLRPAGISGDQATGRWEFEYEYQSRQAGYGDRTGMMLAQVITDHRAKIVVEKGHVTYAVLDGSWDMLRQRMLP